MGAPGTLDCHLWFGGPFERAIDRRWPGRPSEPSDQPPDRTRAAYERGISSRTPIYTSPLQNAADHGGENWGGRTRSAHGEQQFFLSLASAHSECARAATGANAAGRRADGICRERYCLSRLRHGVPVGASKAWLGGRPKHSFRLSLGHFRFGVDKLVAQAPARSRRPRKKLGAVIERQHAAANDACGLRRKSQALFFRRRHQPRRPPLAKIKPGSPGTHEGEWDGPCARVKEKER